MPFMCEYCNRIFPREREVIYHEWRHTGTPARSVKTIATEKLREKDVVDTEPHKHECGCQHKKGDDDAQGS